MESDAELQELAERVGQKLRAAGRRLATAESCTGGWVAKALTDVPGSSQWFECGFVTYSNAAKMRDLGVAGVTLQNFGAVSEQTVREMAEGALRVAGATVSLAVSGIAGPDGGLPGKPVGTVWFCAAARYGEAIDIIAEQGSSRATVPPCAAARCSMRCGSFCVSTCRCARKLRPRASPPLERQRAPRERDAAAVLCAVAGRGGARRAARGHRRGGAPRGGRPVPRRACT